MVKEMSKETMMYFIQRADKRVEEDTKYRERFFRKEQRNRQYGQRESQTNDKFNKEGSAYFSPVRKESFFNYQVSKAEPRLNIINESKNNKVDIEQPYQKLCLEPHLMHFFEKCTSFEEK